MMALLKDAENAKRMVSERGGKTEANDETHSSADAEHGTTRGAWVWRVFRVVREGRTEYPRSDSRYACSSPVSTPPNLPPATPGFGGGTGWSGAGGGGGGVTGTVPPRAESSSWRGPASCVPFSRGAWGVSCFVSCVFSCLFVAAVASPDLRVGLGCLPVPSVSFRCRRVLCFSHGITCVDRCRR